MLAFYQVRLKMVLWSLKLVGKVNEEIDTDQVTGEDLTISFNPTYLIDSLKALNSEKVTISFISAVRPFTLVPADTDEDFMQLITPVRTN